MHILMTFYQNFSVAFAKSIAHSIPVKRDRENKKN